MASRLERGPEEKMAVGVANSGRAQHWQGGQGLAGAMRQESNMGTIGWSVGDSLPLVFHWFLG